MSALITRTAVWQIRARDGDPLGSPSPSGLRLDDCRVALGAAYPGQSDPFPSLASVLEQEQVAGLGARVPVLAIGSNAAPAQLRHKFGSSSTPLVVPSVLAWVRGVRVGFCAFVSALGYVPATVFPQAGAETGTVVQLLDDDQLAEIDETESPAYRRVWLETPILLQTGERLAGAYAYVARGGYLAEETGAWVMGTPGERRPASVDQGRWFADQRSLLARLCLDAAFAEAMGADPDEVVERRAGAGVSERVLRAQGLVHEENALYDLPDRMGRPPVRYGSPAGRG